MLSPRATVLSLLTTAAFVVISAGCSKQPHASSESAETAEFAADLRRHEADSIWQTMMASDDRKIDNTYYFLNLFRYTSIADTADVHAVRVANDSLRVMRYNQSNLRDHIDAYDAAQNRVIQAVGELYNNDGKLKRATSTSEEENMEGTPTQEHGGEIQRLKNAEDVILEIKAADDSVLIFRSAYDKAVEEYNSYLMLNRNALNKGEKKREPMPMFRLNP